MTTLRVYLAGPYAARPLLKEYADELASLGYKVTSRWLDEMHEVTPGTVGSAPDLTDERVHQRAADDLLDIAAADLFVAFTAKAVDCDWHHGGSGGRHVETGYAMAKGIPVILVGEPENVFHRMRQVTRVPNWHSAVLELAARLVVHHRDNPQAVSA